MPAADTTLGSVAYDAPALFPPSLSFPIFGPRARPSLLSFGVASGSSSVSAGEAAGVEVLSAGASMSLAEVVEARLTAAKAAASSGAEDFSLRTSSFYSSESLRMMILPSLGGPRKSWLSSP
jgi:hypothetical protein